MLRERCGVGFAGADGRFEPGDHAAGNRHLTRPAHPALANKEPFLKIGMPETLLDELGKMLDQ